MTHYPACFSIDRLQLNAHIGVSAAERATAQPVAIDVRLYFPILPACAKDEQTKFFDYSALADHLSATATKGDHQLIEFVAHKLFTAAREFLDAHAGTEVALWLKFSKCAPPVKYLQGEAGFVISDLPAGATWVDAD